MILQILLLLTLSLIVGSIFRYINKITVQQLIIGLVATSVGILILVIAAWSFIKQDKLAYNEYWNGYEVSASWNIDHCSEDSGCVHSYPCDTYQVYIPPTYDDKGNMTSAGYYETRYHSCPYTTEEWQFVVHTTLGDYEIAHANFPTDPQSHRFRAGDDLDNSVSAGIPQFWQDAKNRIDAGKPGPVTKRMTYDNFILASDTTILNSYSDKIKNYLDKGLLPKVSSAITNYYHATKIYFVGYTPTEDWNTPLEYLEAGFGTELQGDLHLVIVQNPEVSDTHAAYITALKAYWTDSEVFGKDTISKNGVIVVLGTSDGKTVSWAEAVTGMPLGNEYMLNQIRARMVGAQLNPKTIIGNVSGRFYTKNDKVKVQAVHGTGLLDDILWGTSDSKTRFERISMSANDTTDNGSGFKYLADQVQPSNDQQTLIMVILAVLTVLTWLTFMVYQETGEKS